MPPTPHALVVLPARQLPLPSQHPEPHVWALHGMGSTQTPLLHVPFIPQSMHWLPSIPHSPPRSPPRQTPAALQQPPHVWGPHASGWHRPWTHWSPGAHIAH
jgi:hypothetical protein